MSQISTQWSAVIMAHQGTASAAVTARAALLTRYSGAVYRYLLGAVRDEEAAEELAQEFIVRLLAGDFHRAAPEKGRFRNYVKTVLVNLVNDYHRARKNRPAGFSGVTEPAAPLPADPDSEAAFTGCWREELLERTWAELARVRPNYHAVLRLRVENPDMPAAEMAERLAGRLDRPLPAASVRKTLQRARSTFAGLLIEEVARSAETAEPDVVRSELDELDLLRYCQAALTAWESGRPKAKT